ncbi:MAG: tetratricopeptide repeat protein, partial [Terriglobia bacterium]
ATTGPRALAATQAGATSAEAQHAAGLNHLRAGQRAQAVGAFQQALRLDPAFLPARLELADLLSSSGAPIEAYRLLQKAEGAALASARGQALLGRCFFHLRKFKQARKHFHQALALDAGLVEPQFALAVIETEQGRYVEARKHIEAYLGRVSGPEAVQAWEVLARVSLAMKDFARAAEAYDAQYKLNPRHLTLLRKAEILLKAGRYLEAEQTYQGILAKDANDRAALRGLFEASYGRGAYDLAIQAMQQLAQLEPWSCEPQINLTRAYRMLNELPQARQHAARCLELVPEHANAYYLLGSIAFSQGNVEEAKSRLGQATQLNPRHVEALSTLATAELSAGEVDSALAHLQTALELNPDHAATHYALAQAHARQRRPAEARKHMEEFRRIKSREQWKRSSQEVSLGMGGAGPAGAPETHLDDWVNFAKYLVQEENPGDALALLETAAQRAQPSSEMLRMKAVALTEMGRVEDALAAYAVAEKREPTGLLFYGRGQLYFRLGEEEPALADLRRAASLKLPADKASEVLTLIGSLLSKKARYQEAEAELRRALEIHPTNVGARALLAWTLLEANHPKEAAAEGRQALAYEPRNVSARLILAQALLALGAVTDASSEITQAAATEGESARVLLARGQLAAAQGLDALALDYLRRAAQMDPSQVKTFYALGLFYKERGQAAEAAEAFTQATIVDPSHAPSRRELAKLAARTGEKKR